MTSNQHWPGILLGERDMPDVKHVESGDKRCQGVHITVILIVVCICVP
jgi:hypothetical protein